RWNYTPLYVAKGLETKKLFVKYITKLEISSPDIVNDEGFKKNKKIIEDDPDLNYYYTQCTAELKELKETKVGDSKITLNHILEEENLDKLVNFARNESLEKYFQSTKLEEKFHIYAPDISKQLEKAKELQKLKDKKFICKYEYKDEKTGENTGEYRETEISLYKILVEN
ncbi:ankyrin repeat domain-containing protein, partial [Wolbachia endosymbiont of Pentidionis agamae]|uniref:hypothetical protein n=1 Tax=Wolbachia endosymbiont of Pentidionis agamae TaxID=3110435 RepID=UPI002FD30254